MARGIRLINEIVVNIGSEIGANPTFILGVAMVRDVIMIRR